MFYDAPVALMLLMPATRANRLDLDIWIYIWKMIELLWARLEVCDRTEHQTLIVEKSYSEKNIAQKNLS